MFNLIIHYLFLECVLVSIIIRIPQQYANIQQGIDAAGGGDTVAFAPGIYRGTGNRDIDFQGKPILLISDKGADSTIIDCEADSSDPHRGINFTRGEDSFSVIDGFTVTNGNAYGMDGNRGGAIYIDNCSPKILNCIFSYNTASMGGAVYSIYYGDPIIRNCWFHHNSSIHNGAGITLDGWTGAICEAEISGNIFEYNTTGHSGAAIYANQCRVSITDNIIRYNTVSSTSYWGGGGICLWIGHYGSQQIVKNNLIYGNQAPTGGGIYIRYDGSLVANNTFFENQSYLEGGAVYVLNQSIQIPQIKDCIIWNNFSLNSPYHQIYLDPATGSSANVSYCCIENGWTGTGIIDYDPLFATGPNGEFYLSQTQAGQSGQSPCVDSGSNTSSAVGLENLTTRTDHQVDIGQVDLGYHYEVDSNPGVVQEPLPSPDRTNQIRFTDLGNRKYRVEFSLTQDQTVKIAIYDLCGRNLYTLIDQYLSGGNHQLEFWSNQFDLYAPAIYFIRMTSSENTISRKFLQIN
ncbi:MAG: hypothetical protein ACP5FK_05315 [bacterium]